jgi:predicted dehydrogenase
MNEIGVAVVGAGHWGERHAQCYQSLPEARLVAVCDQDLDRARAVARRHGAAREYGHIDDLLADREISAVSIAVPDHLHVPAAVTCAGAGKHLLVEKPLAMTVEGCESITTAVNDTGVTLMVNFTNRWNAPLRKAKDLIAAGVVGEPRFAHIRMNNTISVPTQWLTWPEKTSVLWWIGSHAADLARWIFDDNIESVTSVAGYGKLRSLGIQSADLYVTTLQFSRGGIAVLENGWILPNQWPSHVDVKVEIIADSGVILTDPYHHRALECFTEPMDSRPSLLEDHGSIQRPDFFYDHQTGGLLQGAMRDALHHFLQCVRNGNVPDVTARDGTEVTRVIAAATLSAETGTSVALTDKRIL